MRHRATFERIGRRIQYFRKERKLSQTELAELSHISLSYMSKIERADIDSFAVITLLDIADALKVPASALLAEDNI
ncbi:MAG: helix-turn-helix transcriptional regulator [Selenomonadaceae bacterium]|nr:helix-turn-helix transcriptional regulator [Selenomonadaceae bacterium]